MFDMRDEVHEQNYVKKACFKCSSQWGSEHFMNKRSYTLISEPDTTVVGHCRQLYKTMSSIVGVLDA